jgi:hypothetical protein
MAVTSRDRDGSVAAPGDRHNRTLTFLETRFPESRKKAYYLVSIYEPLPPQARKDLKEVGGQRG